MKYELKAIFRNKITMVSIFIFIMMALIIFVGIEHDMVDKETLRKENKRQVEYELITAEKNVQDWEENWDYYMDTDATTEEKRKALETSRSYDEWRLEGLKKLLEIYGEKNWYTEENIEYLNAQQLLVDLMEMSMYSWEEEGYETPEVYFAEEIERYRDRLHLDELGFQLSDLADSPFFSRNDHQNAIPSYIEKRSELEMLFKMYDNTDSLIISSGKPYNYLHRLFSIYSYPEVIMGVIMILFSCFYCISCRSDESRRLQEMRPESRNKIAGHYYRSVLAAMGIVLLGFLLIPMVVLGIQNGWGGLASPMRIDPSNFMSWTPYEHNDMYSIIGISKAYSDYDGRMATFYELKTITLGKFLLCTLPIGILKMIFLTLTGFCIGYIGKRKGTTVLAGGIVAGVYIVSQFVKSGMKWNPFSVKSAWEVVEGGTNMTGLNAIVILVTANLLLICLIWIYNRKRDYC